MRPDYLRRTQGRVAQVQQALATAPADGEPALLSDARLVLHDIAGTAAVMGLPEIGTAARGAEDRVVALAQSAEPLREAELDPLRQEIAALMEALTTALGDP